MSKPHNYNQPIELNKYNPFSWIIPEATIGKNCWIGAFVYVAKNVTIGENVSISNGVQIFDHDSSYHRVSRGEKERKYYHITIESDVMIGANTVVIPNNNEIVIGHNSIIGALSLVTESVEPYSVVVGTPAKFVKKVEI